jgi:hypothetical protein
MEKELHPPMLGDGSMHAVIDLRADERAARFDALLNELLPTMHSAYPYLGDEGVLEAAIRVAARRLAGDGFVWTKR